MDGPCPSLSPPPSSVVARPGKGSRGGGQLWGVPQSRPLLPSSPQAPRPGRGEPQNSRGRQGGREVECIGAAGRGTGMGKQKAAHSEAAPKVSRLVRCLQRTRGLRRSESSSLNTGTGTEARESLRCHAGLAGFFVHVRRLSP